MRNKGVQIGKRKFILTLVTLIGSFVLILYLGEALSSEAVYLIVGIFGLGVGSNVVAKATHGVGEFLTNRGKK